MATKETIKKAFIDYVLTEGKRPNSVYVFAKKQKMSEADFYDLYASFDAIEEGIWTDIGQTVISEVKAQDVWAGYAAREKALSFFYSFFELLKRDRSFAVYSLKHAPKGLQTPKVFEGLKNLFLNFSDEILNEGLESGELSDRKFFAKRYKDALWAQLVFVLHFWIKDSSAGFEKTDEAIEKGINVAFDLFQRSPIDNLLDYGKFLMQNGSLKEFVS
ncbi:TetR family transcriptional regulator C-terminal domain-containing protein [Mucilaginibacter auburnensis]|uniref:AcrR family transcriptional regulator n=1 Tax=Mucilaginibacter auburnensis TaxID=1457233 RepID=A0A2H9VMZ0_9SPHI|nr:TetR family transcriptional regulator C-terminal domain-containing protein [Mucilaginibacter auburnensis]PJJ79690.1 AcrR family transcriptional regulator [Mucilaginibacter auburnensis]